MPLKDEVASGDTGGKSFTIFRDLTEYGRAQIMAKKEDLNYFIHTYKEKKAVIEDDLKDKIFFEFYPLFPIGSRPEEKLWDVSANELKDIKHSIEENLSTIYQTIETFIRLSAYGSVDRLTPDEKEILKKRILPYRKIIESEGKKLMRLIAQNFSEEITTNLQNAKNKYIWISCKVKEVICLWDWIYLEQSENFLGDEFFLVRLPGFRFDKNNTNFKIENPVAWRDKSKCSKRQTDELEKKLKEELNCGLQKKIISKYALFSLFKKPVADFIHIAAKEAKIDQIVKGNNANFVFSNICGCNNPLYLSEVQKSAIPTHVIETSFKIPERFSLRFAKDFYYVFLNGEMTMADAFMKVRNNSLKGDDFMNVWRLAYVMCGNPFAKVIR